jgi:hypothetical protein
VRLDPNDWMARTDDGFALAPPVNGGYDFSDWGLIRPLCDGEVVDFESLTDHGSAFLTVADDLTWAVDRPMPAAAMSVECPDLDALWRESRRDRRRRAGRRYPRTGRHQGPLFHLVERLSLHAPRRRFRRDRSSGLMRDPGDSFRAAPLTPHGRFFLEQRSPGRSSA